MGVVINTHITASDLAAESAWFKSSYSNDTGGSCVEIADLGGQVGIRDSKDKTIPALCVSEAAWAAFTTDISG